MEPSLSCLNFLSCRFRWRGYVGLSPFPVIVTTRILTFLVGNPYKPSFPLLLGRGTTQGICQFPEGLYRYSPPDACQDNSSTFEGGRLVLVQSTDGLRKLLVRPNANSRRAGNSRPPTPHNKKKQTHWLVNWWSSENEVTISGFDWNSNCIQWTDSCEALVRRLHCQNPVIVEPTCGEPYFWWRAINAQDLRCIFLVIILQTQNLLKRIVGNSLKWFRRSAFIFPWLKNI